MTEKLTATIDQVLQMNVVAIQELLKTAGSSEAIGAMFMVDNNPFAKYLRPNEQLVIPIPNPKDQQKFLVKARFQNTPPDQPIKTISWQDFLQRLQGQGLINL